MPRDLHKLPKRIRHRFPIFETKVYVNSCSQGALSDSVRASYEAYLRDWDEEGAPWEYWVERADAARVAFAKLINAEPEEIAVTTSGCLGPCFEGPNLVIYPPGTWYQGVGVDDVAEIVEGLVSGAPVERLRRPDDDDR